MRSNVILKSSFQKFSSLESLEKSFKIQLDERQDYVNRLLLEIKEKEKEFEEYCRQVEIDRK